MAARLLLTRVVAIAAAALVAVAAGCSAAGERPATAILSLREPPPVGPPLAPQRPGVVDTYFIGFAGTAEQPVFHNEVVLARDLAVKHLQADARWRLHINGRRRPADARVATRAELFRSLDEAASVMDVEEDVLFLWLSSHGDLDGYLHVRDEEQGIDDDLDAAELAEALDARGFRWRVIVVSACFGGRFIPGLAQERTIVLTSAAANRPSFGCKPDRRLTFFGKAMLDLEWRDRPGLLAAFDRGAARIEGWEQERGYPRSRPTASVGAAMKRRLETLEGL